MKTCKLLPEICKIQYGYPFDSSLFSESGNFPLIRIRDVRRGYTETYTSECCSQEYIVNYGDILIGMDGEFNIAKWSSTQAYLNQRVCKLIPHSCIDKGYLFFFMPKALKEIEARTPFATVKHLSAKELNRITVPFPKLEEQQRISFVLQSVVNIIELQKTQLQKIDQLAKSRFIEMFGNIAEKVPLSYYISELRGGKSLAGDTECANKVLCTGSVSYDFFNGNDVKNLPTNYVPDALHKVNRGDILISRMNTVELVGAAAYVFDAPLNTYIPDRLWKVIVADGNNPIFVWQVLIQPATKEKIRSKAGGTSGSMKNISKGNLLNIEVPQANKALQNEFAAFIEQLDKSKFTIRKSLEKLETLYRALLQEYFD